MKKYSNLIIFGAISTVVLLSVIAFFQRKEHNEEIAPVLINEVINPYIALIEEQKYEKAYKEFTSVHYKDKHTLEEFIEGHKQNINDFGEIKEIRSISNLFVMQRKEGKPWVYKGTFGYIGEDKSLKIIYDIINDDGKWKIYDSYLSFNMAVGNPKSRIF